MILEHGWPVGLMSIRVYSSLMEKLQWVHRTFSCLEYNNPQFEQARVSSISYVIVPVINTHVKVLGEQKEFRIYLPGLLNPCLILQLDAEEF